MKLGVRGNGELGTGIGKGYETGKGRMEYFEWERFCFRVAYDDIYVLKVIINHMLIETLKSLFKRDLNRLRNEIELYKREENLWRVEGQIANSAGNLCLHLIGNLNTYIGKEIGNTGYIRNRELEFSLKDIPRKELLNKIDDTIRIVHESLDNMEESTLKNEYPVLVLEEKTSTEYLLVHLTTHLTYHLGQINYHRRLIDK